MVLLNTPHNPTGKVFTRAELELVCELAREHDAWVVTDEVYEHLVFDGLEHIPVATLPGMAERTLTISSAGKTFSATGWKVGWVSGPAEAVAAVRTVKQFLTYVGSGPFQPAVAAGPRPRRRRVCRPGGFAAGQARPARGGSAQRRAGGGGAVGHLLRHRRRCSAGCP